MKAGELYYVPECYLDDAPSKAQDLMEARAEALQSFVAAHSQAFIAVGPIIPFIDPDPDALRFV